MTVVNPKSISGINSITMASGSDDLLTIHSNNTTERVRVNNSGDVIVGSGVTLSPDGDVFATGVCTATSFVGSGANLTGISGVSVANQGDNRVITNTGTTDALNAEANLTFDGTTLKAETGNPFLELSGTTSNGGNTGIHINANANHWVLESDNYTSQNLFSIKDGTPDSSTARLVIDSSGNTTISSGNLVMGTAGKGIDFSATSGPTNGSDSSELLADYEEGTWTATMQDGNGSNVTLTSQDNTYTKIGRIVHVQGNITLNDTGKSGEIVLKSLPYNGLSGSQLACGHFWVDRSQPSDDTIGGVMYKTAGNARAYFVNPTLGGSGGSAPSQRYFQFGDWANGRPIYFSLPYQA